MTTAMETRKKFKYKRLYDGEYMVYNAGTVENGGWSMGSINTTEEAAKDEVFERLGFSVSPISNTQLTLEEMKDDTKVRRFNYYACINLANVVDFATIKEDGSLEVDEEAYYKKYPRENHKLLLTGCGGYKDYLLKYYAHDILESMKKRNKLGLDKLSF